VFPFIIFVYNQAYKLDMEMSTYFISTNQSVLLSVCVCLSFSLSLSILLSFSLSFYVCIPTIYICIYINRERERERERGREICFVIINTDEILNTYLKPTIYYWNNAEWFCFWVYKCSQKHFKSGHTAGCAAVARICNPRYLGCRDRKDYSSKPAWAKN
jgi:hypothetical protein